MRTWPAIPVVFAAFASACTVHVPPHRVGEPHGGSTVVEYSIESRLVHRATRQAAVVPTPRKRRPLLVLLHGRGTDPRSWTREPMSTVLDELGADAPVVVSVDGGDHSYFHDRVDGDWGRYVVEEVIPDAVERFHADGSRVAIGGHSMGGYGALSIALDRPGTFCAVGGHEPAIWRSGGESAPGAFDDASDFERHDVIAAASKERAFGATKVWIDYGDDDPFVPGDRAFIDALRAHGADPTVTTWPGDHSMRYVRRHLRPIMQFYADALRSCSVGVQGVSPGGGGS